MSSESSHQEIGEWLISHYVATMKKKEYKEANTIFSLIIDFGKKYDMGSLKDEALNRIGIDKLKLDKSFSSPIGYQLKEVFEKIDKLRGYRPPKRNAEAASIQRMLKKGYTPKLIIECWQTLKQDDFWKQKELFLMTIETQIGAILSQNKRLNKQNTRNDPDKYVSGRYGHLVRR